jgi:hypothetical protein
MTQPLIDACASELYDDQIERCRSIAYRLVLAAITGTYGGEDKAGIDDATGLWHGAREEIHNGSEADAVLETLADMIACAMVEKDGWDSAVHDVKKLITEVDPTVVWLP